MLTLNNIYVGKILEDINLHVEEGEFVLVVGPNGAGKTTLFNVISGRIFPSSGSISIAEQDVTRLPQHKRSSLVSSVLQNPRMGTINNMTILENLSLAYIRTENRKITPKTVAYFKEKLSILGMNLENRIEEYAKNLSGGQRQALCMIMAIIADYKVLLLDEVTSALDPSSSDMIVEIINKIVSMEKKTCLLITHNLQQMKNLGNRTLLIKEGKLVEQK